MALRIPLPLTISCFSKIQIGFTFLVPAHPGSPGQRAVKRVCVCVCVRLRPSNQVGPNLFACVMHSLSSAGGAALANVVRNTSCGMEVDFAHKIGCHGNVS